MHFIFLHASKATNGVQVDFLTQGYLRSVWKNATPYLGYLSIFIVHNGFCSWAMLSEESSIQGQPLTSTSLRTFFGVYKSYHVIQHLTVVARSFLACSAEEATATTSWSSCTAGCHQVNLPSGFPSRWSTSLCPMTRWYLWLQTHLNPTLQLFPKCSGITLMPVLIKKTLLNLRYQLWHAPEHACL
jgi:hypothetical protein